MLLEEHLKRQMGWSRATFGPENRRVGVCDHIMKEIKDEILPLPPEEDGEAAEEFLDVVILGMDGMWRALAHAGVAWEIIPAVICEMLMDKQGINEQREWGDWRTMSADEAIEHDRSKD